jgi:hypothetical protein
MADPRAGLSNRDRFVLHVFQMEVAMQCRFALMAYNEVRTALLQGDDDRVWFALQALLVASGNVSKLLWPIKHKHSKRRAVLRATLGIDDTSALKPPCTLRDHLEHFDERLEAWAEQPTRHNFVETFFGSPSDIGRVDPGDLVRAFDPPTATVVVRGNRYELRPIVEEFAALFPVAQAEAYKSIRTR